MRLPTIFEVLAFVIGLILSYLFYELINLGVQRVKRLFRLDYSPKLEIRTSTTSFTEDYLDGIHISIVNTGHYKARKTNVAQRTSVWAVIEGVTYRLMLDSTSGPMEMKDILSGEKGTTDVLLFIRSNIDGSGYAFGNIERYRVPLKRNTPYLTNIQTQTQLNALEFKEGIFTTTIITTHSTGEEYEAQFEVNIPPNGKMSIRKI